MVRTDRFEDYFDEPVRRARGPKLAKKQKVKKPDAGIETSPQEVAKPQVTKSGYTPKFASLYPFQAEAIDHIENSKSTFLSAPTGTGKTVLAYNAMYNALKSGKKMIYTAPIKAISNQKVDEFLQELIRLYKVDHKIPKEQKLEKEIVENLRSKIGIKTGDVGKRVDEWAVAEDNPEEEEWLNAPIQLMTTEILEMKLRSLKLIKEKQAKGEALSEAEKGTLDDYKNLQYIVFDEFHFMNDDSRGHVWESSVINTPDGVQLIPLSATVGNDQKIVDWINAKTNAAEMKLVVAPEEARPVKLKYYSIPKQTKSPQEIFFSPLGKYKQGRKQLQNGQKEKRFFKYFDHMFDAIKDEQKEIDASDKDAKKALGQKKDKLKESLKYAVILKLLNDNDKLPAVFFMGRKAKCDLLAFSISKTLAENSEISILNDDEKAKAKLFIDRAIKESPYLKSYFDGGEEEMKYRRMLENGVAPHHAGYMPQFKELVEKMFEAGLIKVIFSTSTLSAGVNLPVKSVVMTQLGGYGGSTVSMFKQMAGRAGRAGVETEGNVFVMHETEDSSKSRSRRKAAKGTAQNGKQKDLDKIKECIDASAEPIKSKLRASYQRIFDLAGEDLQPRLYKYLDSSFLHYDENKDANKLTSEEAQEYRIKNMTVDNMRMINHLKEKGYLEDNGSLTAKGKLASHFKFNNPLLVTEFLFAISDNAYKDKLESMSPDQFAATVSLLASDENTNFDKFREFFDDKSHIQNVLIDQIERVAKDVTLIQEGKLGTQEEKEEEKLAAAEERTINRPEPMLSHEKSIKTNKASLGWRHIFAIQQWAEAAGQANPYGQDMQQSFAEVVAGKGKVAENPGDIIGSIKRTDKMLGFIARAVDQEWQRVKGMKDTRPLVNPNIAKLAREAQKALMRDEVTDNNFTLSVDLAA